MDDYAPDFEIVASFDFEDWIFGVSGAKLDIAFGLMGEVEILHCKLAIPKGYNDGTVMGFYGLIDDYAVAIKDACILH